MAIFVYICTTIKIKDMNKHIECTKLRKIKSAKSHLYKVYGLINPETDVLFYVGCTRRKLHERILGHFRCIKLKKSGKNDILSFWTKNYMLC